MREKQMIKYPLVYNAKRRISIGCEKQGNVYSISQKSLDAAIYLIHVPSSVGLLN